MPSPWVSAALNRRALRSSFTNRAFGFAVANGSVPSITILISRPARRSRAGTDRSSISSSLAPCGGVSGPSRSVARRAGRRPMSIRSTLTSIRSIRVVRTARLRATGNSGQCLPISAARATRRCCIDGSAIRVAVDLSMLLDSRSHRCTRSLTSCSISAAGIRRAAAFSVRSFVISEPETIVAVARALLYRMARRHPIAVAIKQQAGKEARLTMSCACVPLGGVAGKLCLNRIPQRLIDDRRVLTRMGLLLVDDLASIDPVLQHQIERAAGEWLAAPQATRCARPQLTPDAAGVELILQQPDRAELGIAAKNEAHGFRLALDDDEPAVLCPIPERRHAPHPHPFLLRGGDLVADALADDLALELCEGQQNVEGQAPHRGRRVELLRHRHKGGTAGIEDLDNLGKIGERAGQPVDLVNNDGV